MFVCKWCRWWSVVIQMTLKRNPYVWVLPLQLYMYLSFSWMNSCWWMKNQNAWSAVLIDNIPTDLSDIGSEWYFVQRQEPRYCRLAAKLPVDGLLFSFSEDWYWDSRNQVDWVHSEYSGVYSHISMSIVYCTGTELNPLSPTKSMCFLY